MKVPWQSSYPSNSALVLSGCSVARTVWLLMWSWFGTWQRFGLCCSGLRVSLVAVSALAGTGCDLGCPAQGRELRSRVLMGPSRLSRFCGTSQWVGFAARFHLPCFAGWFCSTHMNQCLKLHRTMYCSFPSNKPWAAPRDILGCSPCKGMDAFCVLWAIGRQSWGRKGL